MQSLNLLEQHPSVQDLNLHTNHVNNAKANHNRLRINAGPLHVPSESPNTKRGTVTVKATVGRQEAVTVLRPNIISSELGRMRTPSLLAPCSGTKPPLSGVLTTADKNKNFGDTTPLQLPHVSSGTSEVPPPATTPSIPNAKITNSKGMNIPPQKVRRASSLVSTEFSFDPPHSDMESVSLYSCSCCHVTRPSRGGSEVNASDYDNLTSISQRTSNRPHSATPKVAASVSTSKVRQLERALGQERESRVLAQNALAEIQRRQLLLLSKLSDNERSQLASLMAAP